MKFEYMAIGLDIAELNRLGQLGWDAVGMWSEDQHDGYGNTWKIQWVLLKRAISSFARTRTTGVSRAYSKR